VEKIVHQIWIGPYKMPERECGFVEEVKYELVKNYPDFKHILWTNDNIPKLPENIKILWQQFEKQKDYAFQADLLRIFLVYEFGGLYLDVDFKWIKGLEDIDFDVYSGLFCGHWGEDYTIPNGCFGGTKHSNVMRFLMNNITPINGWYGPSWMGDTIHKFYGLPREIDHDAFKDILLQDKILYEKYSSFDRKFRHFGLCSWFQENKTKFEKEANNG
jgi:hypothetical protein